MSEKHEHQWQYPHAIWEGRTNKDEVMVARFCSCGAKQKAYGRVWTRLTKTQCPDAYEAVGEGDRTP